VALRRAVAIDDPVGPLRRLPEPTVPTQYRHQVDDGRIQSNMCICSCRQERQRSPEPCRPSGRLVMGGCADLGVRPGPGDFALELSVEPFLL
jgi:hypothetical protein